MLEGLNPRTRLEITKLVSGKTCRLGNEDVHLSTLEERKLLFAISKNLEILSKQTGSTLEENVIRILKDTEIPEIATDLKEGNLATPVYKKWRLAKVSAFSFRGLAPANREWNGDFDGQSHLLFGQNGSGKTSLLGAISWCLTGKIFRDDSPPTIPTAIPTFSTTKEAKHLGDRPDALSLMDTDGKCTQLSADYWVKIELIVVSGNITERKWLKRHNKDGLSFSDDEIVWKKINSLSEIGINETDVEMHILMPARVPYLHYGKDSHFLTLFSQVVGLDDLEEIAEVGTKLHTALTRDANKLEKEDMINTQKKITPLREALTKMNKADFAEITNFDSFIKVNSSEKTAEFGKELKISFAKYKKDLASDLDIRMEESEQDNPEFIAKFSTLPGNVETATTELKRPLKMIFNNCFGFSIGSAEEIFTLKTKLSEFEEKAKKEVEARLDWALREAKDPKTSLMLSAAEYLTNGKKECPVCNRPLTEVPHVLEHLESLVDFVGKSYLKKLIDDLELSLINDLDSIVTTDQRRIGEKNLLTRLKSDWTNLKTNKFQGLLKVVAERFDSKIQAVEISLTCAEIEILKPLAEKFKVQFPKAFTKLDLLVSKAREYIALIEDVNSNSELENSLQNLLINDDDSLISILKKGGDTNRLIGIYGGALKACGELFKLQQQYEVLEIKVDELRRHEESTKVIKSLDKRVGEEILAFVSAVEPRIKNFYESLYDQEHLVFDMLTTGHPANQNIRNDMNIYFRAGDQRIPVSPFANAGRLRGLTISFVFALLEKCNDSFNLLILDDPVYSFDDEHKARFVDNLVSPLMPDKQVILATHYRTFFENAESAFLNYNRLQLCPKRKNSDFVNFEPADLLIRIENALNGSGCNWLEVGINIRKWGESILQTISSYCPTPFYISEKLTDSITAYEKITDTAIATSESKQIIAALKSNEFNRVYNKIAHRSGEPTETELKDALKKLKDDCRRPAHSEITRLKNLHRHRIMNRYIHNP